jgi:hypothetical protein
VTAVPAAKPGSVAVTVKRPAPAPLLLAICSQGTSADTVHVGAPEPVQRTLTVSGGETTTAVPVFVVVKTILPGDIVSWGMVNVAPLLNEVPRGFDASQRNCVPVNVLVGCVIVSTGVFTPE